MPITKTKLRRARFSVFEADLETHELRKSGVRIKLTEQPFHALALLLEHPGEVVTREAFRDALWPNEFWGEHDQRLNRIINKIREALCDSAETPRFIETVPRIGYRFLVSVDPIGWDEPPLTPAREMPSAAVPPALVPPALVPQKLWLLFASVLTASVLAIGLSNGVAPKVRGEMKPLQPVPVTTYLGSETYPSLSPDGKQVALAWDGEGSTVFHIYVAPATGGAPRQITNAPKSDSSPSWSPSGRRIAFLRGSGPGVAQVWTVRPDGRNPVRLREIPVGAVSQTIAWTRDEKWLIVSQRLLESGVPALYRVSAENGEESQITSPSSGQFAGDLSPAVSPDGGRLAFTRSTSPSWRDVFVVGLSRDGSPSGQAARLTDSRSDINSLAWTPDGQSLVFSAAGTVSAPHHLFRVDSTPGNRLQAAELGIEGDHPTLAGSPVKLIFVRTNIEQSSIWRLNRDSAQPRQFRMLSSTRRDFTTDLSPDGNHLVFSSVRSGETEVWMSKTDGSGLRRLTSNGGSEPRWSPDGKRIAFVSNRLGHYDVYVLNLETLATQRLTFADAAHLKPSWSRDGRFLYFCSDRTGWPQIWKAPSQGGDPVQITRQGGLYAVETFDGKSIYYTSPGIPSKVWVTSANGGEETEVIHRSSGHASIALGRDGLYFSSSAESRGAELDFFRFADQTTQVLASIDHPLHAFLSSSSDGRSVLFTQLDRQDRDLMMVEPFQ